jgi:hypothetical protein
VVLFSFRFQQPKIFFCQPIITHKFDSFIALVIQSSCQFKQINTYALRSDLFYRNNLFFLFYQVHLLCLNLHCQAIFSTGTISYFFLAVFALAKNKDKTEANAKNISRCVSFSLAIVLFFNCDVLNDLLLQHQ